MEEEIGASGPADRPIDRMSVDELNLRLKELKAETAACEAELAKKKAHKSAADGLFGGNG
ncbi:MAG: DUF1192 family protein [Hyphomonadaceae bacterium]